MKIEHQYETEIFINQGGSITIKQKQWPEDHAIITNQLHHIDMVITELKLLKKELKEIKKEQGHDSQL